jgi:protein SSD1
LLPGEERLTVSVVFKAHQETGVVDEDVWIGKSIIKSSARLSYDEIESVIKGASGIPVPGVTPDIILGLQVRLHPPLVY